MIDTIHSCAFTGHRPKSFAFGYDESSPEFLALKAKLKNTIIQVCNAGCRTFYCGMAEGVDLWCGEIVLELQDHFDPPLNIVAVVPYLAQPKSMSRPNQIRYRKIMEKSSNRFLVSSSYSKRCFEKRNRFMVDSADSLIAVLKVGNEMSGTGQTIRYAKKKNRRIFLIQV